jgi:hypothetical protein
MHDNTLLYNDPTKYWQDPNIFLIASLGPGLGCDTTASGVGSANWWLVPWTGGAFATGGALSKTTTYCTNINVTNSHQLVGFSLSPTNIPASELIQEAIYASDIDSTSALTLGTGDSAVTITPGTKNLANGAVALVINAGAGSLSATASGGTGQTQGTITVTLASGGSTSAATAAAINAITLVHTTWNITASAGGTTLGLVATGTGTMFTSKPVGAPLAQSHTGGAGVGFAIPTSGGPQAGFAWTTAQPATGQGGSIGLPLTVSAGDVYFHCAQITAPTGTLSWRTATLPPPNALQQFPGGTFGTWPNYSNVAAVDAPNAINQMVFVETSDAVFP